MFSLLKYVEKIAKWRKSDNIAETLNGKNQFWELSHVTAAFGRDQGHKQSKFRFALKTIMGD